MTLWELLDRIGERRAQVRLARPTDARLLANVIGAALISGFLGALFALFIIPIPKENEQIITYMIGQLSGFAGGIVAYHYTMSAGQKELDAKHAASTEALATAVNALAPATDGGAAEGARETADAASRKAAEIEAGASS